MKNQNLWTTILSTRVLISKKKCLRCQINSRWVDLSQNILKSYIIGKFTAPCGNLGFWTVIWDCNIIQAEHLALWLTSDDVRLTSAGYQPRTDLYYTRQPSVTVVWFRLFVELDIDQGLVTSAKEDMYVIDVVCLSVCLLATLRKKTSERICMKFSGKVGNGPTNKWLNFGGDPVHGSEYGLRIRIATLVRRALAEVQSLSQCF